MEFELTLKCPKCGSERFEDVYSMQLTKNILITAITCSCCKSTRCYPKSWNPRIEKENEVSVILHSLKTGAMLASMMTFTPILDERGLVSDFLCDLKTPLPPKLADRMLGKSNRKTGGLVDTTVRMSIDLEHVEKLHRILDAVWKKSENSYMNGNTLSLRDSNSHRRNSRKRSREG